MIYQGKQYAKIFFKKEEDQEECKMCAFKMGGLNCSVFLSDDMTTYCWDRDTCWSWAEVGELPNQDVQRSS